MNNDPTQNLVRFLLRRSGHNQDAMAMATVHDENAVQRAWETVRRTHEARAEEVSDLTSTWEPSAQDARFIARSFPDANIRHTFARPAPDGWVNALDEAQRAMEEVDRTDELARVIRQIEDEQNDKLLPVLCGPSSGRGEAMLSFAVHQPLVPAKLSVMLAMTGRLPGGKTGLSWLTHHWYRELGEPPFADLLDLAAANLAHGMQVESRRSDNGDELLRLYRENSLVGSAVAMPGFHDRMSSILHTDRLIVGIPCPDDLLVTGADSDWAEEVRTVTLTSEYTQGFLGPSLLLVERSGITLLADRPV